MSNTEQQQPTTAPAPQVVYVEAPKKSHKIRNLTVGLIGSIAVIAAISTAAGGGEAEVVKEVDASAKAKGGSEVVHGEAGKDEAPAEAPADSTAELGDTVRVGDWDVTITDVNLDADALLTDDEWNSPAKHGWTLITYKATYAGTARTADVQSDLTFSMTDKGGRIVDDAWAMVPMDWENASGAQTETRPGGTVTYQSAFDAGNPTMVSVVGYDADYNETWADFPLT